jgi:hypothetical protein
VWDATSDTLTLYGRNGNSLAITNDTGWTTLGSNVLTGKQLESAAIQPFIGNGDDGTSFNNDVHDVAVYINGTLTYRVLPSNYPPGSTASTFTCSTGQTVTIAGSVPVVVPTSYYLPIRSTDTYLKADDLQVGTSVITAVPGGNQYSAVSYFEVEAYDYTSTQISWGVPLVTTLTSTPKAVGVVIVYSPQGEPATVNEGFNIVEGTSGSGTYLHTVSPGSWAYYTIFVKYQDNTGYYYYEPAASLSVLVPKNYGSSDILYSKISSHYQEEDGKLGPNKTGPLYRYLSLIGWDIDQIRTITDYLVSCKDPQVANSQELDLIANDLGIDLISKELGAARLRSYLDDIGKIRRSGGTNYSINAALTALTNSVVTISGNTINVQPQRVNFLKDPMLTSIGNLLDGGLAGSTYSSAVDGGSAATFGNVSASVINDAYFGGYPSTYGTSTSTVAKSGVWSSTIVPGLVSTYFAQTQNGDIPVTPGDVYYFSIHNAAQSIITSVKLIDPIEGTVIVTSTTPQVISGRYYWKLTIPSDYAGSTYAAFRLEYTQLSSTSTVKDTLGGNLLLEKNRIGDYFDGNTRRGGWITNGSTSIADFRWLGETNNSYSVYSENFQKTASVVTRLLPTLLPVTKLATSGVVYSNKPISTTVYTIVYNYIPPPTSSGGAVINSLNFSKKRNSQYVPLVF